VGRVDLGGNPYLPENRFPSLSPWCQQLTRNFLKNTPDILVNVRGSGVKVRFESSFGREK